jgi:hypothetical protein
MPVTFPKRFKHFSLYTRDYLGFDPRTVQLVASGYTDYANRPTDILRCAEYLLRSKM